MSNIALKFHLCFCFIFYFVTAKLSRCVKPNMLTLHLPMERSSRIKFPFLTTDVTFIIPTGNIYTSAHTGKGIILFDVFAFYNSFNIVCNIAFDNV